MGSSSSKVAVSSVKLVTKKQPNKNTRNLVLNPRLCQSIFDNTNEFCYQKDVQHLRKFMFSDSNLKPTSMSKKKVLENELIKYINLPQSETKVLTHKTSKHLEAILVHLKGQTSLQKPFLVSDIIETKLENIYERNNALQQQHQSLQWTSWLQSCVHYIYSMFRFKLTPKTLRKNPKLKPISGLDRAHKLSLSLAVGLWEHVYGHRYVKKDKKKVIACALNVDSNMYYTCKHTNRTVHVKLDKEISDAVKSQGQVLISSGAKLRVKQVLSALSKIKKRSPEMSDFCGKCRQVLIKLL